MSYINYTIKPKRKKKKKRLEYSLTIGIKLAPKFRPLGLIFFPLPPILSKSPSSPRCPPLILSICLDFGCYVERWIEEIKERNKKKEEDKEAKASSFCGFFISTLL